MTFDVNKVQELLDEAAAGCYQQNGFPQKKEPTVSKFADMAPEKEKFTDFSQVLAALEQINEGNVPEKIRKFSPLAEGVNAALQQMGITKMEVLSNEGATAIVLRGWSKDHPNGCVIRMVDSHTEGATPDTPAVLQPYDSKFINAAGEIDKDPLTATPKKNPETNERLPSGARITLVPEVVSLVQATKFLVSIGKLSEEDASSFKNEVYNQHYKSLSTEYVSNDHNDANLYVLPPGADGHVRVVNGDPGSVVELGPGPVLEKNDLKRQQKMHNMVASNGMNPAEIGSTAAEMSGKLDNAQKHLRALQTGQSVATVAPSMTPQKKAKNESSKGPS